MAFLDAFGFDYEFQSSTELLSLGHASMRRLLQVLRHATDEVMEGHPADPGRRSGRRPTVPSCRSRPKSGKVLQVPIAGARARGRGQRWSSRTRTAAKTELPVTGGHCKLQWKVDWAMRWYALDVDYEMSGKDLIDSVKAWAARIVASILGGRPPEGFNYELFLDEQGQKISKSKGNGLSVEEWLAYAPPESLALFMHQKPRAAKRLFFDVIPRAVDDYFAFLRRFPEDESAKRLENPAWHIHDGSPPTEVPPLSFAILLNLASVCNSEDPAVLWGFVSRYVPEASPETAPVLDGLIRFAIAYYRDFVKPKKHYRAPDAIERTALEDLLAGLEALPEGADAEAIQTCVYEVGKRHDFADLKSWFKALYEVLLGQSQGPRMGSFMALYGLAESKTLIGRALAGEDLAVG